MILSHDTHAIIAQCTPKGSGALALLRLCGQNALAVADKISTLSSGKLLSACTTHTIHHGYVCNQDGTHIDEVLFLLMKAPHTFTGQDTVEITCHNNPFIIEHIIAVAIAHGARPAQEGEFSKRAVLNNKIDVLQAEAINDLINANTQIALKQSLAQIKGSLSDWICTLEKNLLHILTLCEASFEFLDDEETFDQQIQELLQKIHAHIAMIKQVYNQQQHIRQGIRIALIGSVNAGKSSLLNALIGQERAIVTECAGTTRDVIEAGLYKNGIYWTLIDTAGLRQTHDAIEQEGIKRSYQEAQKADIILLVIDNSRRPTQEEDTVYQDLKIHYQTKIIEIYNKSDICNYHPIPDKHTVTVSATTKENIVLLEQTIKHKIQELLHITESPFLLNTRHVNLLHTIEQKLIALQPLMQPHMQYELISYHLNDALSILAQLTGKSISEQGLDAIFKTFCVGK